MYKKILTITFLLFFIFQLKAIAAIPFDDKSWEFVLARDKSVYYLNMNSIDFSGNIIFFWIKNDDRKSNKINFLYLSVDTKNRMFRYEECHIYDINTQKVESINIPSEWKPVGNTSVVAVIMDYIHKNYTKYIQEHIKQ